MPTQLSPLAAMLMQPQQPAQQGMQQAGLPNILAWLLSAMIPNPQTPYAFGSMLPARVGAQGLANASGQAAGASAKLRGLSQWSNRLALEFEPGQTVTPEMVKSLFPDFNTEVELLHGGGKGLTAHVWFMDDAYRMSSAVASKAADMLKQSGLTVFGGP